MGQYDVLQIIKDNKGGKKMSINEIKKEYSKRHPKISPTSNTISVNLSKLRRFNMVRYSTDGHGNDIYRYWV